MRDDYRDPPIIIEKHNDIGTLLVGLLIGAGVALLFAPKPGKETRRAIRRTAREAGDAVRTGVDEMTGKGGETLDSARERAEEQIASARSAISAKKEQVSRAIAARRETPPQPRCYLEGRV